MSDSPAAHNLLQFMRRCQSARHGSRNGRLSRGVFGGWDADDDGVETPEEQRARYLWLVATTR